MPAKAIVHSASSPLPGAKEDRVQSFNRVSNILLPLAPFPQARCLRFLASLQASIFQLPPADEEQTQEDIMHDCTAFAEAILDLVRQSGVCTAILPPGDNPVSVFIARFAYVARSLCYKSSLTEPSQRFCQSLEQSLASLSRTTYCIFDTVRRRYSEFEVRERLTRSDELPTTKPPPPAHEDYAVCFCVVEELFVLLSPLSPDANEEEVRTGLGYQADKEAILAKRQTAARRDTDGDIPALPAIPEGRQLLAGNPELAEFYRGSKEGQAVFCQVQFRRTSNPKIIEWLAVDVEKARFPVLPEAEAEKRPPPAPEVAEESPAEEPEDPDSNGAVDEERQGKADD
jgi:hypothetical protein